MKEQFKKFLIGLSLVSSLTLLIGAVLFITLFSEHFILVLPFVFVFFIGITTLVHFILLKANRKNTSNFVTQFMLATFIKLMVYLIFLASYVFIDKENAVVFLVTFGVLYIIFTAFEVASIIPVVKTAKE